jgi:hypothetical protein
MARKTRSGGPVDRNAIEQSGGLPATIAKTPVTMRGRETDADIVRDKGVTLVVGQPYAIGDAHIPTDAIYFIDGAKPSGEGPWLGEADKIAWRDVATGYECIIMRDATGGYLSGYVGVPRDHPLYGFEHEAIPAGLDIDVHGGLTYSALCDEGPTPQRRRIADEARRICHVPPRPPRYRPVSHATDYRVQHDDAWWLGFECNHVYDLIPDHRPDRDRFLAPETGAEYRDEGYVYGEVVHLAAQLRAIADGMPKPKRTGAPPPPRGLDPEQGA